MPQHVTVVPYDTDWPRQFEREANLIRAVLGEQCVAVHHIGSTAVPGLQAKPIIDIMPVVTTLARIEDKNAEFVALGYECMGEFGIPGRRYYRKGGDHRTHQLHLFSVVDQEQIERHLAVRDYLRAFPAEAEAYGALKADLARRFPEDIEGYCDGKDVFVRALEARALAWRHVQDNK